MASERYQTVYLPHQKLTSHHHVSKHSVSLLNIAIKLVTMGERAKY